MNSIRHWTLLAGLAIAGCYTSSGPQTSGNTNWLKLCKTDASCEADASCVCGVCTRACDTSSECGGGSAQCVDPAAGEIDNRCASAMPQPQTGICLRGCAADRACGLGLSCEEGSCVASVAATPPAAARGDAGHTDGTTGDTCDATQSSCNATTSLSALIDQSRKANRPANPAARVWSCEAGALRVDPAGYDEPFAIAAAGDALLIAGVSSEVSDGAWRIERRGLATLTPAPEFGERGAIASGATELWDAAGSLAVDSRFLYVAGVDDYDEQSGGGSVRIEKRDLTTGALVPTFGREGSVGLSFGAAMTHSTGDHAMGHGLTVDADFLYLGGTDFAVEKRSAVDGAPAPAFGDGGVARSDAAHGAVATIVSVRDGVLYAAGPDGDSGLRLEARDAMTGALRYAARQPLTPGACHSQCVGMAAGTDDDLYLSAMTAAGRWRVERRQRATGALVYAHELEASGGCDGAPAIAIDDRAMYVAGVFDQRWRIEKRSLADGALIESFGRGGAIDAGLNGAASAIALREGVLYVAGIEGPRNGVQSSVWRIERRSALDGSLIDCPTGTPELPRAPECAMRSRTAVSSTARAECAARVASSSACAAANVRTSKDASAGEDWSLPEGAAVADGTRASVSVAGEPSSVLLLRGFGLELPEHARILGIEVDVLRASAASESISDAAVQLVRDGEIASVDRARAASWSADFSHATYGGPDDVWDGDWTGAQLNDPSFGVALRVRAQGPEGGEAQLDAVRVDVHYCE